MVIIVILLASIGYTVYQQQQQQAQSQAWSETLVIGVTEPFANPDPNIGYASADGRVNWMTMCRLWTLDDKDPTKFHPEVADSWQEVTLPDGRLALQIKIHPGLVFQDGTPINATAVGMSLDRIIKVEPSYGWQHPWTSWETPDLNTLNLIIATPLDALAIVGLLAEGLGGGGFASPSSYATQTGGNIVGCGPYKFSTDGYVPNERIVLDRWENYPFKDHFPTFKHMIYRLFADSATMRLALEKGDIDVADKWLAKSDLLALGNSTSGKYVVDYGKGLGQTRFLFMNQRFAPLNDSRVRQAIAYALDINAILDATQYGLSTRAYTLNKPLYPYGVDVFKDKYAHNVAMAKQLLAQAGYPNGFKSVLFWSDEFDIKEIESNVAALIKQQLAAVGIDVEARYTDWGSWTTYRRQGNVMQMGLAGWLEDWPDIDSFMWPMLCPSFQLSCPYGWTSGINDTQLNQLLLQGRNLYDPSKPNDPARSAVYAQIQSIMADKAYVIPFWYNSVGEVWRSYVHDYKITWNIFTDDNVGINGPPPSKVPEAGSNPTVVAPVFQIRKFFDTSVLDTAFSG